jgi:hypothetical protein
MYHDKARKASEVQKVSVSGRSELFQEKWSQVLCLPRNLVESLEASCAAWEDTIEEMSIL